MPRCTGKCVELLSEECADCAWKTNIREWLKASSWTNKDFNLRMQGPFSTCWALLSVFILPELLFWWVIKHTKSFQVENNPKWPRRACLECVDFLDKMISFHEQIISSHKWLYSVQGKIRETNYDFSDLSDISSEADLDITDDESLTWPISSTAALNALNQNFLNGSEEFKTELVNSKGEI